MKLIKKLARDELRFDNMWAQLHKRHEHVDEFKDFFAAGFEAGFRKAREMALDAHAWPDDKYFIDGFGNPDNPRHIAVHEAIKHLGESEAAE